MVISEEMMKAVISHNWVNGFLYFHSQKLAYAEKLWQEYVESLDAG